MVVGQNVYHAYIIARKVHNIIKYLVCTTSISFRTAVFKPHTYQYQFGS